MKSNLKTIHFYRHPEVIRDANICAGQLDSPLIKDWKKSVTHWKESSNKIKVISSPLSRCLIPAQHCFKTINLSADILERNFGIWEGESWDNIDRDLIDLWQKDLMHFKPTEGESTFDMKERIKSFILAQTENEQIWISHQGVYRILKSFFTQNGQETDLDSTIDFGQLKSLNLDPKKLN